MNMSDYEYEVTIYDNTQRILICRFMYATTIDRDGHIISVPLTKKE